MKRKNPAPDLKEQFAQAKALIQRKQYAEARALLHTIDHPTAQDWLTKLDKLAPVKPPRRGRKPAKVLLWLGAIIALMFAVQLGQRSTSTRGTATPRPTRLAAQIVATVTPSATITETATLTPGATITETATVLPAVATADQRSLQAGVSPFGCNQLDDLNCSDFEAAGQNANTHLAQCGDEDNLDQDLDGRACEGQTELNPVSIPTAIPVFNGQEASQQIMDGLSIVAGGRDIESVRVADGRPGGERAVIVTYLTRESTQVGIIDEVIDIFQGVASSIDAFDLDVDSVALVAGTATGAAAGILTVQVEDLLAFSSGQITRGQFIDLMEITTF